MRVSTSSGASDLVGWRGSVSSSWVLAQARSASPQQRWYVPLASAAKVYFHKLTTNGAFFFPSSCCFLMPSPPGRDGGSD